MVDAVASNMSNVTDDDNANVDKEQQLSTWLPSSAVAGSTLIPTPTRGTRTDAALTVTDDGRRSQEIHEEDAT
eukprot:4954778-Prymnesium_polylepis.1